MFGSTARHGCATRVTHLYSNLRVGQAFLWLADRLKAKLWPTKPLGLEDFRHEHLSLKVRVRPELVGHEGRRTRDGKRRGHPALVRKEHLRLHEKLGGNLDSNRGVLRGRAVERRVLLLEARPLAVELPEDCDSVPPHSSARLVEPFHRDVLLLHGTLERVNLGRYILRDRAQHARAAGAGEQNSLDRELRVGILLLGLESLGHVLHVIHRGLHLLLRRHRGTVGHRLGHLGHWEAGREAAEADGGRAAQPDLPSLFSRSLSTLPLSFLSLLSSLPALFF